MLTKDAPLRTRVKAAKPAKPGNASAADALLLKVARNADYIAALERDVKWLQRKLHAVATAANPSAAPQVAFAAYAQSKSRAAKTAKLKG